MARSDRGERRHRRHRREHVRESHSESDSTDDEDSGGDKVKMIEAPREGDKRRTSHNYDDAMMSGGLGDGAPASAVSSAGMGNLREDTNAPGQYIGYVRNPPPPSGLSGNAGRRND
jgi:zinc finger CCCH domain-containing protein 13